MKPFRSLSALATLALTLLFAFAVTTANASTKPPAPPPPVDNRVLITAVDAAAGTIVIEDMHYKTTHTYTIDGFTVLKVNNSPGKIADIKVGMQVRDSEERNHQILDTLTVDMADPAPVPPPKK